MKLSNICLYQFVFILIMLGSTNRSSAQYRWEVRDPVDLRYVDLADNKLLLYNGLAMALILWLDKEGGAFQQNESGFQEVLINVLKEYNRDATRTLQSVEFRKGYRVRSFLYTGGGMSLFRGDGNVPGLGFNWFFKWHIIRTPGFTLSYDNGVGPNLFTAPFPEGGTRFSFSTHYGLSFLFKMVNAKSLVVKFINIHISNAGIKGRERNPALDAFGMSVGWTF